MTRLYQFLKQICIDLEQRKLLSGSEQTRRLRDMRAQEQVDAAYYLSFFKNAKGRYRYRRL